VQPTGGSPGPPNVVANSDTAVDAPTPSADAATHSPAPRHRWWREVLLVVAFYSIYTAIRNTFGSEKVSPGEAFDNARHVVRLEKLIGLYQEERIQNVFLGAEWFVRFWNVYYGTFHFFVTAGALIACYHLRKRSYRLIRNTLAASTALALAGFALFPLMPPRLLDDTGPYGAGALHSGDYGYVDTLAKVGGLWSFDSGTMQSISNQYAAMPSLHIGWSLWCVIVLWPLANRRWWRATLVAYPLLTLFCIVVTANHYWIDGLGGVVTLMAGYVVARAIGALWRPRGVTMVTVGGVAEPGMVESTQQRRRRAGP
jgi:hypothetical protein